MRKSFRIEALSGYAPEIGRWLWALESVRRRTLASVKDLGQGTLDWRGEDGQQNSIGSLLYHIALVEMSWLFEDILMETLPDSIATEFPHPMATKGRLSHVPLETLDGHLERLERTRTVFLDSIRELTPEDWRRVRKPDDVDYEVTPEWAVFHLIEHEAGHTAQIRALRATAERRKSIS